MKLSAAEIEKVLNDLEKDTRALKEEALHISWYMRGGISYDDAMLLCVAEREIINKIIKENLETTKKSGLPFF